MRLGINLMAWSGSIGPAELDLLPGIAALGYDGVELPVFAPEAVDTAAVRRALEESQQAHFLEHHWGRANRVTDGQ
jgi:sugar phosphate isomerase/epimerase